MKLDVLGLIKEKKKENENESDEKNRGIEQPNTHHRAKVKVVHASVLPHNGAKACHTQFNMGCAIQELKQPVTSEILGKELGKIIIEIRRVLIMNSIEYFAKHFEAEQLLGGCHVLNTEK